MTSMIREGRSFSGRERHCCFLNLGGPRFACVAATTGLDLMDDGRALAMVDWDHDGDLDFWLSNRGAPMVRFLRNDMAAGNHFLAIRLHGDPEQKCNRDAVGTRVELHFRESDDKPMLIKSVRAGDAYLSQSTKWLHFGLGASESFERLVVRWPGGAAEEFTGLEADRHYQITQGGSPQLWTRGPAPRELAPSTPQPPGSTESARIVTVGDVMLGKVPYQDFAGREATLPDSLQGPTLINLWAPWCAPCLRELTEFSRRAGQLRSAGLEVLALNVDGLGGNSRSDDDPQAVLQRLGFDFPAGNATAELMASLEVVDRTVLNRNRPFPLPTSFLVDAEGKVAVIYKGPISVEQLTADLRLIAANATQERDAAAALPGNWALPFLDDKPPSFGPPPRYPGESNLVLTYTLLAGLVTLIATGLYRRSKRTESAAPSAV